MTDSSFVTTGPFRPVFRNPASKLTACCLAALCGGCSAFNPAFLDLLPGLDTAAVATVPNPPGYVVVTFVNNVEVSEQIVTCLKSTDCGCLDQGDEAPEEACEALPLTDAEQRALKPRMRFRVQVNFTDGTSQQLEFIDGSKDLIKPNFDSTANPDLNQNDLNTVVTICDVASVEVVNPVEVFVPIAWSQFEQVDPTENAEAFTRIVGQSVPQFVTLQVDEVDEDLNTTLRRNVGLRDTPGTVNNPLCGSVVAITIDGALSVPFFEGRPGYDRDDPEQEASVGGRYEFTVSVQ